MTGPLFVFILMMWMFVPMLLSFRALDTARDFASRLARRDDALCEALERIADELASPARTGGDGALVKAIESQLVEIAAAIRERPLSKVSNVTLDSPGQSNLAITINGREYDSPQLHAPVAWLRAHPEAREMSVRSIASSASVSKSTAAIAKQYVFS
jgi:hypothetical protein